MTRKIDGGKRLATAIQAGVVALVASIAATVSTAVPAQADPPNADCNVNPVTGNCIEDDVQEVEDIATGTITVAQCRAMTRSGFGAWFWTIAGTVTDPPLILVSYPATYTKNAESCDANGNPTSWSCRVTIVDSNLLITAGGLGAGTYHAVMGTVGGFGNSDCGGWDNSSCPSYSGAIAIVVGLEGQCFGA